MKFTWYATPNVLVQVGPERALKLVRIGEKVSPNPLCRESYKNKATNEATNEEIKK